jgi:uncharacterized protein YodC (DUF2158 family)
MTTQENFNVGDIVQINSGGPHMTVEAISGNDTKYPIQCVWFVGTKMERNKFATASLILVDWDDQ